MAPLPDSGLVTVKVGAAALGLSESQGYRLLHAGQLPGAVRLGNRWRVRASVLRRWLDGEDVSPPTAPIALHAPRRAGLVG